MTLSCILVEWYFFPRIRVSQWCFLCNTSGLLYLPHSTEVWKKRITCLISGIRDLAISLSITEIDSSDSQNVLRLDSCFLLSPHLLSTSSRLSCCLTTPLSHSWTEILRKETPLSVKKVSARATPVNLSQKSAHYSICTRDQYKSIWHIVLVTRREFSKNWLQNQKQRRKV